MNITIWVEPKMYLSNWYHELENGFYAALNAKHLKASITPLPHPDLTVKENTVIVLVGETYEWYNEMLTFTNQRQLTACVCACEHPMHSAITVTSDYTQVAYNMMQYLYDAGKKSIAFFGVNPSSPHDNMRLESYRQAVHDFHLHCNETDIYYTKGDINQCASAFRSQIGKYDAVLCTNDLYAFFALTTAKKAGFRIPEDLFIAGFGNTMISSISKPTITTATVNLYNIGYQTIAAIQLMNNNNSLIQLDIKSDDVYLARESTANIPFSEKYRHHSNVPTSIHQLDGSKNPVTSFNDNTFMDVVCYEALLKQIDQTDCLIICSIVEKQLNRKSLVAEACFLSDTALDYRLKRLYKRVNVNSYQAFYQKMIEMANYIDLAKLHSSL